MINGMEMFVQQNESLRRDLRLSKIKILLELFLSSFLVFYWSQFAVDFMMKMGGIVNSGRIFLPLPLILNATAWLMWFMLGYLLDVRGFSARREYQEEFDERALYDQYQHSQYILRRHKLVERFVDIITALQFGIMAISLAYQLYLMR